MTGKVWTKKKRDGRGKYCKYCIHQFLVLNLHNANNLIIIIMTLFKCQMYLARTALIGDTFQIELEFRNLPIILVEKVSLKDYH